MPPYNTTDEVLSRFVTANDGCWIWTGSVANGYGHVDFETRTIPAHRFFFAYYCGDIPEGFDVHHRCEIPLCVNPEHLEALSRKDHVGRHRPLPSHCKRGHEFNHENTYHAKDGHRDCRVCARLRYARRLAA